MSLIFIFALFVALLFYTLCYYVSQEFWFGDVIVAVAITAILIGILIISFYL